MSSPSDQRPRAPLNDEIALAVAGLVNDAQADKSREPTHSDIEFQFEKAGLMAVDPKRQGQTVGKAKRVRAVLSHALEVAPDKGEVLVAALISLVRAKGGFRKASPNYCGDEPITDTIQAFRNEGGYSLTEEGVLQPTSLDTLSGAKLTAALESYVKRARRGSEDAALVVGTAKDLLEATAAHVIQERYGSFPQQANLPTLLGQAFVALDLTTPLQPTAPGEPPQHRLQRALYEAGCAVNALRNKQGTGHGRPWLPTVTDVEARAAVQLIGIVSSFLLAAHKAKP
jgi:GNAT superfamily N-acetyltransferase